MDEINSDRLRYLVVCRKYRDFYKKKHRTNVKKANNENFNTNEIRNIGTIKKKKKPYTCTVVPNYALELGIFI